jgi:hypothetical protein
VDTAVTKTKHTVTGFIPSLPLHTTNAVFLCWAGQAKLGTSGATQARFTVNPVWLPGEFFLLIFSNKTSWPEAGAATREAEGEQERHKNEASTKAHQVQGSVLALEETIVHDALGYSNYFLKHTQIVFLQDTEVWAYLKNALGILVPGVNLGSSYRFLILWGHTLRYKCSVWQNRTPRAMSFPRQLHHPVASHWAFKAGTLAFPQGSRKFYSFYKRKW